MNINTQPVSIPQKYIDRWNKEQATATAKQREEQIAELEQVRISEETDLPPLRQATARARADEEQALTEYKAAQEKTRLALGEELEQCAMFEHRRTQLEQQLRQSTPACIAEFIAVWEREFQRLGNTILPRTATRKVPGRYTPGGDSIMETVSNGDSL